MTKSYETYVLDSYRVVVLYSDRGARPRSLPKSPKPPEGLQYCISYMYIDYMIGDIRCVYYVT